MEITVVKQNENYVSIENTDDNKIHLSVCQNGHETSYTLTKEEVRNLIDALAFMAGEIL